MITIIIPFSYVCLLFYSFPKIADSHGLHDDHDHNHSDHVSSTLPENSTSPTTNRTDAYIFGTISVLIVSLLSLVGAGILPFVNNKNLYRGAIVLFMSLAVGTMTSDAMLHLIPECLGVHGHDASDHHDHKHGHEEKNEKAYIGVMCAILASLYFLYLFEIISIIASKHCKSVATVADIAAHGHSHGSQQQSKEDSNHICLEMKPPIKPTSASTSSPSSPSSSSGSRPQNLICGLKPVAFIVLVGDGLHNFADGLAIGAAFMAGSASGLATSIAVVCHELPHEVGDFAILLNSGLSIKKALLLNLLSALTAFAGLYVGIEAGSLEGFRKWIFAVVAGGFLYVGLVHMLHEIKDSASSLTWYAGAALQNIGLLIGFVIVLLLAIYEEDIGG